MPDPVTNTPNHFTIEPIEYRDTGQIVGGSADPYPGGHAPPFQTPEERQNWITRRSEAEMRQRVPIAVAPSCTVKLPSGRIAFAGEEVGAHELPADKLSILLDRLVLIRTPGENLVRFSRSSSWRFRVADGKALIDDSKKIVASGAEIKETDLNGGLDRIRELIALGLIVENPESVGK